MGFKSFIGAICACLVVVSYSVNASAIPSDYVDNVGYTTNTRLGLDWLDLSYTIDVAYNDAVSMTSLVEGGGWTYATNEQVNTMFYDFFPGWTAADLSGESSGYLDYSSGEQLGIEVPEIAVFHELFNGVDEPQDDWMLRLSLGLYRDETDTLRSLGTAYSDYDPMPCGVGPPGCPTRDYFRITGPDSTGDFEDKATVGSRYRSTFLVRDTSVVPVPATVWLFGSGLLGLIGIARRRES